MVKNREIIVLGASQTALSTLRCLKGLKKRGARITLVYQKNKYEVALASNIPHRNIIITNGDWADGLLKIRNKFFNKPVLLFTQDDQVVNVSSKAALLLEEYLFLLPNDDLVTTLMEKDKFTQYSIKNNLSIPFTKIIYSKEELLNISKEIEYPIIIKPYLLHALIARNKFDLVAIANNLKLVNFNSIIAQRFVGGGDDQLYFCFLLFDENSNVKNKMLARKLRQWPVDSGTTSLAITIDNESLIEKSIKIFKDMNYVGFGSIEYKYDKKNDDFVIMEPTVGRFNQQIALSQSCTVNFPEALVRLLFKEDFISDSYLKNKYWMFESNDFFSYLKSKKYGLLNNYFKSNFKVLFSISDPLPFFYEIYYMLKSKLKKSFS